MRRDSRAEVNAKCGIFPFETLHSHLNPMSILLLAAVGGEGLHRGGHVLSPADHSCQWRQVALTLTYGQRDSLPVPWTVAQPMRDMYHVRMPKLDGVIPRGRK